MNRRTRASRAALMTFSAQPWTLFEGEGGDGGGGTGNQGPALNEHGFPDATPVADMAPEHAAAYWKHQSRKWEGTAKAAPTPEEIETLRTAAAELATRKAADMSETERLQAEAAAAKAEAEAAKATAATAKFELTRTQVAAAKGLTPEQAARLQGSTKEELEADADALLALFTPAGTQPPGPRHVAGHAVNGAADKTVSAGEARYRAKYGTTT